jgi:hypothetical protein
MMAAWIPRMTPEEAMYKFVMRATLSIAALAILLPVTAQAADPVFCAGYADAALNQVRGALSNPNCAAGARGARWSPERHVHFDWCLTQPAPAVAAERDARTAFLRVCRG